MKPLLSLIIPVYKAEEFIEACLSSVFTQIPDGVEVILVDDGTPDDSIYIVRRIFSKWIAGGQLVLLEQSNMGPGAARNIGIRKSRGDFIAFLDSDDVLLEGYFSEIVEHLKSGVADIIEFGFKRFRSQAHIPKEPYRPLYSFDGLQKLSDVREQVFAAGCWFPSTRVYCREIFERFQFPEGTHYEDLMLLPDIYRQDFTVYFIDKPLLGYRFNPASITSNHTMRQFKELYGFYKSILADDSCEATKILKLKVARSIVFFYSEIKIPGFKVSELVSDIRQLRITRKTRKRLSIADRLLLQYPGTYVYLDAFRVPLKKLRVKIDYDGFK